MAFGALIALTFPLLSVTPARAAGGAHSTPADTKDSNEQDDLTPEQKMQKRFPQTVRIGALIGLPLLDENDSTIGYVRQVVRDKDGKVSLIVPYRPWFGWAGVPWGQRDVAVPIENAVILARQLNTVDLSRDDLNELDTFSSEDGMPLSENENTLIGLGRR